jgi:hypothetical protein
VPGLLALVPSHPAAPGPPLEVPATAGGPDGPATARAERERRAVDDVLASTEAWTQIGVATAPNEVSSLGERGDVTIKWLDGPRGRYRLRHDPGHRHDVPGRGRPGRARLVGEDAASPAVRRELEAALDPSGRRTV